MSGLPACLTLLVASVPLKPQSPTILATIDTSIALPCIDVEVQSPRDITPGAAGFKSPRGIAPIADARSLVHVNTHFHLGAEHMNHWSYNQSAPSNLNTMGLAPGRWCNEPVPEELRRPFNFLHCKDVEVGNTYEVHSVWSNSGTKMVDGLDDGFTRGDNPYIVVQAQVVQIVNGFRGHRSQMVATVNDLDLANGWAEHLVQNGVKYLGSTTGPAYNNTNACSPITATWHVDRHCHRIHAADFDRMCEELSRMGLRKDLGPHGSRAVVLPSLATTAVLPL